MSPTEIVILLALTGYAIYQQSRQHQVVGSQRFKLAIIYAIVGLVVGGMNMPKNAAAWGLLVLSIALSVGVGLLRGRLTRVWAAADGTVYSQGTALTIGLFLGLVATKFAIGTAAYFLHISDDGGFGEVLIMIAIMVAFQAQLIWRRAQSLSPVTSGPASSAHRDADVTSPAARRPRTRQVTSLSPEIYDRTTESGWQQPPRIRHTEDHDRDQLHRLSRQRPAAGHRTGPSCAPPGPGRPAPNCWPRPTATPGCSTPRAWAPVIWWPCSPRTAPKRWPSATPRT